MIDLNDFIIGQDRRKRFKCVCIRCGKDRGYHRKKDTLKQCQPCANKHTIRILTKPVCGGKYNPNFDLIPETTIL